MKDFTRQKQRTATVGTQSAAIDEGQRAFMLRVYNYMSIALAITGFTALAAGTSESIMSLFYHVQEGHLVGTKPLGWVIAFAPLGMVFFLSAKIQTLSNSAAQTALWVFSLLMGLSLSYIFMVFTGISIARVLFITAGTFAAMSLYGYTTKRDLTGLGSFLIMGLFGIIIASIVNIFLQSAAIHFAVSIIGVLIFVGLTAYDTQRLKMLYLQLAGNHAALGKAAVMGALSLYLDFINLFIMLLQFFGERR